MATVPLLKCKPPKRQKKQKAYLLTFVSNVADATVSILSTLVPTATSLSSNPNPSTYGQSVAFVATVESSAPGGPTGTVTFKNGSNTLGSATLSGTTAVLNTANLPAGTASVVATYKGDGRSQSSSSDPVLQGVNKAVTTTTVVSSRNPSKVGQVVKFTATVSSPTVIPTGAVTFLDGVTTLSTVKLARGKASYSTSALSAGEHDITAVYGGDSNIEGSKSSVLVQSVN